MPISDQGQLDLSTFEQFKFLFQDSLSFPDPGGGNPIPVIAADPGDGYRSVTKLDVTATSGSQDCGVIYEFAANQPEVWVEFDVRYTHPAGAGDGTMALFALLDSSNAVVASLNGLTDSSTEWRADNAATPSSFGLTTGIAKNAWERIRFRYKQKQGGTNNGILQAWRYNFGTSTYDLQLNITNHDSTTLVRKFVIKSGPTGSVRSATGSKSVWFRALTWGLEQAHVGFKHRGLQFGRRVGREHHRCAALVSVPTRVSRHATGRHRRTQPAHHPVPIHARHRQYVE